MFLLFLALVLDWYIGDPDYLWRRFPHPVVLFGAVIDRFDSHRRHYEDMDLFYGFFLISVLFVLCFFLTILIWLLYYFWFSLGFFVELFLTFVLLGQRSLYVHVDSVRRALLSGDLAQARICVSKLVGRDMESSDASDIGSASIESLSENYVDAVLSPIFWYLIFGVFGILFYKAVNTADSMIGNRSSDYVVFGMPAARLDDILNYIPSRLSVFVIGLVSHFLVGFGSLGFVVSSSFRDGGYHPSPNSGLSQSAFAASLDLRLGGPRYYSGILVSVPFFHGSGRSSVTCVDIVRSLYLYRVLCFFVIFLLFIFISSSFLPIFSDKSVYKLF